MSPGENTCLLGGCRVSCRHFFGEDNCKKTGQGPPESCNLYRGNPVNSVRFVGVESRKSPSFTSPLPSLLQNHPTLNRASFCGILGSRLFSPSPGHSPLFGRRVRRWSVAGRFASRPRPDGQHSARRIPATPSSSSLATSTRRTPRREVFFCFPCFLLSPVLYFFFGEMLLFVFARFRLSGAALVVWIGLELDLNPSL